jgi:DNA modification methylase
MAVRILPGHVLDRLGELPDESVNCVVTSPPYWGLRDYGVEPQVWGGDSRCQHEWSDLIEFNATNHTDKRRWQHTRNGRDEDQPTDKRVAWLRTKVPQGRFCERCGAWAGSLGLEPDYHLYVEHIVAIFTEIRRVLRSDGTVWLNLGDTYCNADKWGGGGANTGKHTRAPTGEVPSWTAVRRKWSKVPGLKPKDLTGVPWRVAFALQDAGWWLRKDNVVHKRNPMPESVEDRTTTAHEYCFHLTKSERYWYDAEAIKEPASYPGGPNAPEAIKSPYGQGFTRRAPLISENRKALRSDVESRHRASIPGGQSMQAEPDGKRNRRSVWTVSTSPTTEAHFATMPEEVAEICILAGCPVGGMVLDPFLGSGTTAIVADRLARDCIGIELQPQYVAMSQRRARQPGLALVRPEVTADDRPKTEDDDAGRGRDRVAPGRLEAV